VPQLPGLSHGTICTCYCRFCGCEGFDSRQPGGCISAAHGRVDGHTTRRQDAVSHEWRLASAEHKNIAEAVAACSGIAYLAGQPASIREQLRLDVLPDGGRRGEEETKKVASIMTTDGDMKTWSLRIGIAAIVTASDSGSCSPSETAVPDQSSSAGANQ
jgi:hypothetical protein